jgi:sulfur carrier protein
VNGDRVDVGATDLASALKELGYGDAVVATALNGEFISASSRSAARLTAGDRLEILAPMQGG